MKRLRRKIKPKCIEPGHWVYAGIDILRVPEYAGPDSRKVWRIEDPEGHFYLIIRKLDDMYHVIDGYRRQLWKAVQTIEEQQKSRSSKA